MIDIITKPKSIENKKNVVMIFKVLVKKSPKINVLKGFL